MFFNFSAEIVIYRQMQLLYFKGFRFWCTNTDVGNFAQSAAPLSRESNNFTSCCPCSFCSIYNIFGVARCTDCKKNVLFFCQRHQCLGIDQICIHIIAKGRIDCSKILIPIVLLSAIFGPIVSLNSSLPSLSILCFAPESGASTLSPEQSSKYFADTLCHKYVVNCHATTLVILFPEHSASRQDVLSKSVMFLFSLIFPNSTLSQSVGASVGLRYIFSSSNSASIPVSLFRYSFAPRTHIRISDEQPPPSTGRS